MVLSFNMGFIVASCFWFRSHVLVWFQLTVFFLLYACVWCVCVCAEMVVTLE